MNVDDFSFDELINSIGLKAAQEAGYISNVIDKEIGIMAGTLSSTKDAVINFTNGKSTLEDAVKEVKTTTQSTCETYLNYIAYKGLDAVAVALKANLPGIFSPIIDIVKVSITQPIIEMFNKGYSKVSEFVLEKIKFFSE